MKKNVTYIKVYIIEKYLFVKSLFVLSYQKFNELDAIRLHQRIFESLAFIKINPK